MDPALKTLVEAAERGEDVPRVRLMAGSALYAGHLGTREQLWERLHASVAEGFYERPTRKAEANSAFDEATRKAGAIAAPIYESQRTDDVLVLLDCSVLFTSGGGTEMPVVRVQVESIDAWWVGVGKEIHKGSQVLIGGFFPIPIGN